MSKFEGTVEDIVFRNDQNGWTVAAVKLDGDRSRISAVGIMPFLSAGEHAIFDGELTEHREYGQQIRVDLLRERGAARQQHQRGQQDRKQFLHT